MAAPDRARRYALKRRRLAAGGFTPLRVSKLSAWRRLAASTPNAGEWDSVVDVLNNNPATQSDTDRRPAVGASANGLPTEVYDGSDVMIWPLVAGNNQTTKTGYMRWFKPASVASVQHLFEIGVTDATAQKLICYASNQQVFVECYISGTAGRFGRTGNVLTAAAWSNIYVQYDSSRGGDANLAIFVGGVSQSLTYGNLGAGGTLTTLPSMTGSMLIGGASNSDTPTQPIANGGELGPNEFWFNDNLTVAEELALRTFEAPT